MSDIGKTTTNAGNLAQGLNLNKLANKGSSAGSLIGNGSNLAQNFAQAQSAGARPAFNLQFNALQNSIIGRMNDKINQLNLANAHKALDASLQSQRAAFVQLGTDIEPVREATLSTYHRLNAIAEQLTSLNNQVADAAAGNTAAFDQTLAAINEVAENLQIVDGTAVGIVVSDGSERLKRNGVLMVTNADGSETKATSYADFFKEPGADPSDSSGPLVAITSALNRLFLVQDGNQNRADILATTMDNVQKGIDKIDAQMTVQAQLDLANKAAEVAKIKQQYSFTLQSLSLAFESSQSMTDALTARLNSSMQVDRGSVMSLFT